MIIVVVQPTPKGSTAIYTVPTTEEKGAMGHTGRGGGRSHSLRPLQRNGNSNGQSKNPALVDRRRLSANGSNGSDAMVSQPAAPSAVATPAPEINASGMGPTAAETLETLRKRRSRSRPSTA
ncbi:MAG: hypothetical protein TH68_07105 [Candidatus Synechococcus spongiarum 142]|uniref:Uncharacterized protein n=1 Tax=Candidatus Synechococcus spongiarum 142 TaxID=1608213 RepID=A0A6N3X2T4_9SYNE|nr:MAG: hypothetical protein TH68_07105 [Candidatus Synechococcus spongiarum 142]